MTTTGLLQIAAVLLSGLVAGLLYGYDCSVIRGLGKLGDKEYLAAFQSINKAIQNPYFFLSFMGALIVLPLSTWMSYQHSSSITFFLMLGAAVIYVVGVSGVTIAGNVPLNNEVENFNIAAANPESLAALRQKFESGWNAFHHVRTYASICTFLLTIISLMKR